MHQQQKVKKIQHRSTTTNDVTRTTDLPLHWDNIMPHFYTHDSCTGRYCSERVLAMGILSVRLSISLTRPGTESSPGEIETPGFHHMVAQSL